MRKGYKAFNEYLNKGYKFLECLDMRYMIHKSGEIISLFGNNGLLTKPNPVRTYISEDGYLKVTLTLDNSKKIKTSVHRLLAVAFLDLDFNKKNIVVNHKNGKKLDNRIINLELVSRKRNSEHAALLGLYSKNKKRKFTKREKYFIKSLPGYDDEIFKEITGISLLEKQNDN